MNIYYLNKDSLPSIPNPHDCVIKRIEIKDRCIEFIFEDDISYHDSIRCIQPQARSLIMRYHFVCDTGFCEIYKWVRPKKPFEREGHYKRVKESDLPKLAEGKYKLEYLYHNVGYCSIITKLFSNGYIILDADIDYVELEWIF